MIENVVYKNSICVPVIDKVHVFYNKWLKPLLSFSKLVIVMSVFSPRKKRNDISSSYNDWLLDLLVHVSFALVN